MSQRFQDLKVRTFINGGSAIVLTILICFGHLSGFNWLFATVVAGIGAIAIWEYCQLLKQKQLFPAVSLSVAGVVLYVYANFFKILGNQSDFAVWFYLPEIVLGAFFLSCFIFYIIVAEPPIINISTCFFGMFYIGVPLGFFLNTMYFFKLNPQSTGHLEGSWWIIFLLLVTKSSDIGGYFFGSHFGKRKLALKLSPNKTLEGALGGLFVSVLVGLMICFLGKEYGSVFERVTYWQAILIGLTVGCLGQVGDLAESFLKRDAKVKDSNSIPGVGGILDMIDSLLFTTPLVYLFLKITY